MSRYLVVDDNEAFGENLAEILVDRGHEVRLARDGETALEEVGRGRFDALLTDMRMPRMSGAELVHRIRQLDPGLPAILVTAYSAADDLKTARSEGLLAVLGKPLDMGHLMNLLGSARRNSLVVLVEDDAAFADNVTEVLQTHGFTTIHASSLLETRALGALSPLAAVVDLRIPGGGDGEAMTRLAERFPGLPLYVVTGHDLTPPLPARRLFKKPFDPGELVAELKRQQPVPG